MKYWSPLFSSLVALLVSGMASLASASAIISVYGHYEPSTEPWLVDVSASKLTVGHGPVSGTASSTNSAPLQISVKSKITVAVSPKWEARTGWFVFVENSQKIWAYDGAQSLLFDKTTPKGGVTSQLKGTFNTISEMPPKEVLARLPESMQKALDAKFPAGH